MGSYDTNSDVARELIAGLLFVQANIVSVDTASAVAPAVTLIQVSDPRLIEEATKTSETLFGPVEVVLAPTVLEGVDQVVTLGESYLGPASGSCSGSRGPARRDRPGQYGRCGWMTRMSDDQRTR